MGQEAPATAYLVTASMFRDAAMVLLRDPPKPAILLPTLFLIHHAIELYLKAYLSLTKEVEWIHDIVALFDECERHGYKCSDKNARLKIQKLRQANEKHYLRYLKWGDRKTVAAFLDYQKLLSVLQAEVGPIVIDREIGPTKIDGAARR